MEYVILRDILLSYIILYYSRMYYIMNLDIKSSCQKYIPFLNNLESKPPNTLLIIANSVSSTGYFSSSSSSSYSELL